MGVIRPAISKKRQANVDRSKAKITELVKKGVKTNLRSASGFTVNKVATSFRHPQKGKAKTENKARMQVQRLSSKPSRTTTALSSLRKSRKKK